MMEYLVHPEVLENQVVQVEKVGLHDTFYLPNVLHQDSFADLFCCQVNLGKPLVFLAHLDRKVNREIQAAQVGSLILILPSSQRLWIFP